MLRGITISYSTYEKKDRNNLVQDRYSTESHDAVDSNSLNENKVLWKIFARKVPWALIVSCPLDRGRRKNPQNILAFWNLGTKKKWNSRVFQVQANNCIFLKKKLTISQRLGIISCLPKDDKPRQLKKTGDQLLFSMICISLFHGVLKNQESLTLFNI